MDAEVSQCNEESHLSQRDGQEQSLNGLAISDVGDDNLESRTEKKINESVLISSVFENACVTNDMAANIFQGDSQIQIYKRKKRFEVVELDSKGIEKNLKVPMVRSSVPEEVCSTSEWVVDDASLVTCKRKKGAPEVAELDSKGLDENLGVSMLKSQVSKNPCHTSEILDNSLIDKHSADTLVRDVTLTDEKLRVYERMKCQKSYHQEEGSNPQIIHPSPQRSLISSRRKLLILDVNGVLSDFVTYVPKGHKADIVIANKSVFIRPFSDEFLQFCFQNFDVGVWSSRAKHNLDRALDFLMGDSRRRLLFCWDQFHCSDTGLTTPGTSSKPLFLKELRKLWEKLEQDLPGYYNASNTLLLDDSPYKALRNPPYTAIFPPPYRYDDFEDNSLGHGGSLRVYLEGLAMAENVQTYVEQNPFGQGAITETNPHWAFYRMVRGEDV